jgi:uncharacterized protein (TIRG00374 family)
MKKRTWLIRLLGVILFIVILTRVDLSSVLSVIADVNLSYLGTAIVLTIPMLVLKSWRWQSLLKMQGIAYPLRQAFPAYVGGLYLGMVTPGRLGELGRAFYLTNDRGLSLGAAFSSVVVDRLLDIYVLLLAGGYGLIAYSLLPGGTIPSVIILVLLVALPLSLLRKTIGKGLIRAIYHVRLFARFRARIDTSADQFYHGVDMLARPRLILPLAITLAAWAVYFAQCYLLVLSLEFHLSYLDTAVYMAAAILVTLIPISIAGIGTRDATLIALFSVQGIDAESALSYSLLVLFSFYVCVAVMATIAWQIKPIQVSRGEQDVGLPSQHRST